MSLNMYHPLLQVDVRSWLDRIPESIRPWLIYGGAGLLAVLIVRAVLRAIARSARRRRPATIHPKLARYNIDHAEVARRNRELAVRIIASTTGAQLAGYRITRQIDAVFVEGHRTPDDAMIALKAMAADRGANGLINVRTERTAAGKCSASGDAVLVEPQPASPG